MKTILALLFIGFVIVVYVRHRRAKNQVIGSTVRPNDRRSQQ